MQISAEVKDAIEPDAGQIWPLIRKVGHIWSYLVIRSTERVLEKRKLGVTTRYYLLLVDTTRYTGLKR